MTDYRTSADHQLALNTYIKLVRCTNSVSSDIHSHLPAGLTVSQFGILEALYHLGPMPQKELARKILKSAGNITTIINNLEKSGLVIRSAGERDRRFVQVSLTSKGQDQIEQLFPPHADRILQRMARLSKHDQKKLGQLLSKLADHKSGQK